MKIRDDSKEERKALMKMGNAISPKACALLNSYECTSTQKLSTKNSVIYYCSKSLKNVCKFTNYFLNDTL